MVAPVTSLLQVPTRSETTLIVACLIVVLGRNPSMCNLPPNPSRKRHKRPHPLVFNVCSIVQCQGKGWYASSVAKAIEPWVQMVWSLQWLSQNVHMEQVYRVNLLALSSDKLRLPKPSFLRMHSLKDLFKQWRMFNLLFIRMELGNVFLKYITSHQLSRCH